MEHRAALETSPQAIKTCNLEWSTFHNRGSRINSSLKPARSNYSCSKWDGNLQTRGQRNHHQLKSGFNPFKMVQLWIRFAIMFHPWYSTLISIGEWLAWVLMLSTSSQKWWYEFGYHKCMWLVWIFTFQLVSNSKHLFELFRHMGLS